MTEFDEDKIKTQEELYSRVYDILEKSGLWWTDEVEVLFDIISGCVSPYIEKKRLSEGEVLAFIDFQKETMLRHFKEDREDGREKDEKNGKKRKDFGDKRELR